MVSLREGEENFLVFVFFLCGSKPTGMQWVLKCPFLHDYIVVSGLQKVSS